VCTEAGASDVAVYAIAANGTLSVVSGPLTDGQKAACWIAAGSGGWQFVANAGSNTISMYRVGANG